MALSDFLGGVSSALMGGPQNMVTGLGGQQMGVNPLGALGTLLGIPDLINPQTGERQQVITPDAPDTMTPGFNPEAPSPWSVPATGGPMEVPGAMNAPERASAPAPQKRSGLRNFLGELGDALLMGSGADPIYGPRKEREELSEAMAQYFGTTSPELADVVRQNPAIGMELLKGVREDRRFDRTAGQDDQRIGIGWANNDLGNRELNERIRSNQAGEGITQRGQDVQVKLQQMRMRDAELDRQQRAALQRGDQAFAMQLEQLRQANRLEIARLSGGNAGMITETIEYPGQEAQEGTSGFLGIGARDPVPATPSRKVVTTRPAGQPQGMPTVTSKQQYDSMPSGSEFIYNGQLYRKP